MEAIKLNNKDNIINAYGAKPQLFYDIEGNLIENNGKDIKVQKILDNKNIIYSLRLKQEIVEELGSKVFINKDNILSMKIEEEKEKEEAINSLNKGEIIKELGLEDNEETKTAIKHLMENRIPITKENLDSFFLSKRYLEEVVENLDLDTLIKLMDKGVDIEKDSLQKIQEALYEIKSENKDLSLLEILGLEKKLNYKEAELIAKEIYGRKMGKDVYDSIMALYREDMEINRENIEKLMEIMDKAHDLQNYDEEDLIIALKEEEPINIETLYRLKHSYKIDNLDKNIATPLYEQALVDKGINIGDILQELNLEINLENKNLIGDFIYHGLDISLENYRKLVDIKHSLEELINLLNENTIAQLLNRKTNVLNTEIHDLIDEIKDLDKDIGDFTSKDTLQILRDVEDLRSITYRDLIQLIKSRKDLNIGNLKGIKNINLDLNLNKNINSKVAEKALTLNNIYNTLGELDSNTIYVAVRKYNIINLNNLYEANVQLKEIDEALIEAINPMEESIIRQEYLNAKTSTTLNLIKTSIKDGVALEHMPLDELNNYIDRKISRYKEMDKLAQEVKYIKGKEDYLIPKIMKNGLNMTLGDIRDFNSLLNPQKGLGHELNSLFKRKNEINNEEIRQGIQGLESSIKKFTQSLKTRQGSARKDYKKIVNTLEDLGNSFNSNGNFHDNMYRAQQYLELQNRLKKDLALQIPIEAEGEYKNINLIIPNGNMGIDKNNMAFYFNLNTENLGDVKIYLKVVGKQIYMELETKKGKAIANNQELLEEGLNKIDYNLVDIKIDT